MILAHTQWKNNYKQLLQKILTIILFTVLKINKLVEKTQMTKCRNNGNLYHCRTKGKGHPFLHHAH